MSLFLFLTALHALIPYKLIYSVHETMIFNCSYDLEDTLDPKSRKAMNQNIPKDPH